MACSRAPAIAGDQPGAIGLAPGEETRIAEQPIFHHLGIAGAQLARGQGVEAGRVDQHRGGLVEGADQILAGLRC